MSRVNGDNRLGLYGPALPIVLLALSPLVALTILALQEPIDLGNRNWRILGNTIALTSLTVSGSLLLGIPFAFFTTCLRIRRSGLLLAALVSPLAIPSYIGAFAYFAATGPGGEFERYLNVAPPEVQGLFGTAWVMILYTFPFVLLSIRASLRRLDASLVDAARTLGLTPVQSFFYVVLPRIRGGIAAGGLIVALYTLSDFATPAILGFDTFTRAIYVEYNAFGLSKAAWFSLQLLALVFAVLYFESKGKTVAENPGRPLRWTPSQTGSRFIKIGVMAIWSLSVGLPLSLFVLWLFREGLSGFEPDTLFHSIVPAALAAGCALLFALPLARSASAGGRIGALMLRTTTFGFGLPGIVMGTALVYVSLRLPLLYQTTAMLVLGYVLRFLPLATGTLREGFDRIETNTTAAARSLGASRFETFRRIKLPLLMPAALSGAALVFLESMRELPLTLLLQPTGSETLTTRLWQVYEAGYFGEAAVPGLLLIAASFLAMLIFLRSERLLGLAAEAEA